MSEHTTHAADGSGLPRAYGPAGHDAGTVLDAFDDLEAGDRVLWGDRQQPCTVARVVEPDDRVGQALAFSVISPRITAHQRKRAAQDWCDLEFPEDFYLEPGDVFAAPNWGTLRGKRFVVVQGPRGGFYAIAEPESGRKYPALFRAVRSFHSTKMGRPGQGAWNYERDFDDELRVVDHDDAPDELDPEGDLPAYDDIADSRVVGFDQDAVEHYTVAESVADLFDAGYPDAYDRLDAEAAPGASDDVDGDDIPIGADPDRVAGMRNPGYHAEVVVTDVVDTEYGPKGVVETPPPWEVEAAPKKPNDVIKSTPWDKTHYEFDSDREAWLVDADELTALASEFRDHGYAVAAEYDLPEDWPA